MVRTVCANHEQGGGQREVRAQHLDHRVYLQATSTAVVEQENESDLHVRYVVVVLSRRSERTPSAGDKSKVLSRTRVNEGLSLTDSCCSCVWRETAC